MRKELGHRFRVKKLKKVLNDIQKNNLEFISAVIVSFTWVELFRAVKCSFFGEILTTGTQENWLVSLNVLHFFIVCRLIHQQLILGTSLAIPRSNKARKNRLLLEFCRRSSEHRVFKMKVWVVKITCFEIQFRNAARYFGRSSCVRHGFNHRVRGM